MIALTLAMCRRRYDRVRTSLVSGRRNHCGAGHTEPHPYADSAGVRPGGQYVSTLNVSPCVRTN